jgi:ABC-2 type transport system permease protein
MLFRYVNLIRIFTGASISAQMEYRANFIVSIVSAVLASGGALFGLSILTSDGQPVGGWSFREACVVVGVFTLVQGFIGACLYPNLNKIGESIRLGTMDFTLLKPIDSQFLVSTRNINVFRLSDVCIGLGVITWAAWGMPGVTLGGGAAGAALLGAALMLVYSIWFLLTTTAFWFVKVENITELFNGLFRAGQFPVSSFPGWVRLVFTAVVPVAFITTVPAEAIIGRLSAVNAGVSSIIALAALAFSRWMWARAIGSYTSASS